MQNFDHNISFWEKRQIFRWKFSKIAENCDHNIDLRIKKIGSTIGDQTAQRRASQCQTTKRRILQYRPNIEQPNVERPNIERPNVERPNIEAYKCQKT
jgi:hypothetical protein